MDIILRDIFYTKNIGEVPVYHRKQGDPEITGEAFGAKNGCPNLKPRRSKGRFALAPLMNQLRERAPFASLSPGNPNALQFPERGFSFPMWGMIFCAIPKPGHPHDHLITIWASEFFERPPISRARLTGLQHLSRQRRPRAEAPHQVLRFDSCASKSGYVDTHMAMGHNLCLYFGANEHPFTTYFDVHHGYRVLTHSHMGRFCCWFTSRVKRHLNTHTNTQTRKHANMQNTNTQTNTPPHNQNHKQQHTSKNTTNTSAHAHTQT